MREIPELIKSKDICIHCSKIKIYQKSQGGVVMYGYGHIKINNTGSIYLEYVCTKQRNIENRLGILQYPKNNLSVDEELHLSAEAITGQKFTSSGFSFQIENSALKDKFTGVLFLTQLNCEYTDQFQHSNYNFLRVEFNEKCSVTKNKLNSIRSTLGSESHSRNQAEFTIENNSYSIVSHKDHTEICVSGYFNVDLILESILFYIGFSSGVNPQPYYIEKRTEQHVIKQILSIDDRLSDSKIPPVIPENCLYNEDPHYHYKLLEKIINIKKTNSKAFDSSNAQWQRIWHSFKNPHSIVMLTLSVSIEGLLNDLYKDYINRQLEDPRFDSIKLDVIDEIKKTEISPEHQTTIISQIERWGNIYPNKMLDFMISKGTVTEKEKKSWSKLRNKSAHPTNSSIDTIRNTKELQLIYDCINIFNKLVLNIYNYKGPYYSYNMTNKNNIHEFNPVDYAAL